MLFIGRRTVVAWTSWRKSLAQGQEWGAQLRSKVTPLVVRGGIKSLLVLWGSSESWCQALAGELLWLMWSSTSWTFSSVSNLLHLCQDVVQDAAAGRAPLGWGRALQKPSQSHQRTRPQNGVSWGGRKGLWRPPRGRGALQKGRRFQTEDICDMTDPKRDLFGASLIWLRAKSFGESAAINSPSGAVSQPGERGTTDTKRTNYGNTVTNHHTFRLFPYKAHWCFPSEVLCSSPGSPFSKLPFFIKLEYKPHL